jgi:hypothetical protein
LYSQLAQGSPGVTWKQLPALVIGFLDAGLLLKQEGHLYNIARIQYRRIE